MKSSSSVVPLPQPDTIDHPLTAVLRSGARRLLAHAFKAEADAFLATLKGLQLPDGRDRVVRHGHGPERQVQTGIGPVAVQRVRLRDRGADQAAERIRLTSAILPRRNMPSYTVMGRGNGNCASSQLSGLDPCCATRVDKQIQVFGDRKG